MTERTDVVIVGGGIAGGALATALARDGLGVTVLEATEVYEDRVRGETMVPWGVAEARELGIEQAMLDAGAHVSPAWVVYLDRNDPAEREANPIPMAMMVPDIPGTLNLRHPDACTLLTTLAEDAGADVLRGVRDVEVTGGTSPSVRFRRGDDTGELACRLIVGADGRNSVVRRSVGIELETQPATNHIAGLLVDGLDGVPSDRDFLAGGPETFSLVFHQGNGRARLYVCMGDAQRKRFAGRKGAEALLEAFDLECIPFGASFAAATPAGPCATYPGTDTWCARPFMDGVVLVGDAAGHNDPVIGQGLSIALRDARTVRDALRTDEWSDFSEYGDERFERMRRLRLAADVIGATYAEDADNRAARHAKSGELQATDERMLSVLASPFAGPECFAPEMFDDELVTLVRTA